MDLLTLTGIFLMGTAVFIPVTYLLSSLFHSILLGTITSVVLSVILLWRFKIKLKKIHLDTSSILLIMFSLAFSTWLMFKTFHGGANGELFVGSNNVFDFGHSLGIIRSFSWGTNLPMMSPFESGSPFFYHFLFYFWVAMFEYFRIPLVWAMNIPSILSFSALLIVVYYFPQIVARQKSWVGWIAVLLTITNSSLTFWKLLPRLTSLWRLPTYPFAGPFDGSTISIYMTLNNYVNQRHLAFSVAAGLFLILLASRKMTKSMSVLLGVVTGLLFLWNVAICVLVAVIIILLYILKKQFKYAGIYILCAVGAAFIIDWPNISNFMRAFLFLQMAGTAPSGAIRPAWNLQTYLWENLGVLPIIAGMGFVIVPKKYRQVFIPFAVLFILECLVAGIGNRGFDQKYISFLIIGVNMLAATAIFWLWQRSKYLAVVILFIVMVSGLIDLIPIKNEFAFPLVDQKILPVISWIHSRTRPDAVFVSYADIVDPVVLAGRKNYFGFFGNIGWKYRTDSVRQIYDGDARYAVKERVNYILIPKWNKSDFPYTVNVKVLESAFPVAYTDTDFLIFKVN